MEVIKFRTLYALNYSMQSSVEVLRTLLAMLIVLYMALLLI